MTLPKTLSFKDLMTVNYAPGQDPLISRNAKKRKGNETETSGPAESVAHAGTAVTIKDGDKVTHVHKLPANPQMHHISQELRKSHSHLGDAELTSAARNLAAGKPHKKGSITMSIAKTEPKVMEAAPAGGAPDMVGYLSKGMKWDPKLKKMVPVQEDAEVVDETRKMKGVTFTSPSKTAAQQKCTACNGSGYYDTTGSPKCSQCNGTGKKLQEAVLNPTQRRAKAILMKRLQPKIKLGRDRAARKFADMDRLKERAKKAARSAIFRKLTKGIPKDELTYVRRQEIEKRLDSPAMKARIERMAVKMLPQERQMEVDRHHQQANPSTK